MGLLTEPVLRQLLWGLVTEPFRPKRSPDVKDESIADFANRRLGPDVTDNIISAIAHGIYAGDINKLSAKTFLDNIWGYELSQRPLSMEIAERLGKHTYMSYDLARYRKLAAAQSGNEFLTKAAGLVSGTSVITMKKGMGQISDALHSSLASSPNVEIKAGAHISEIAKGRNGSKLSVRFNLPIWRACLQTINITLM